MNSESLCVAVDGEVSGGISLQVDLVDSHENINNVELPVLQSPQDGGIFTLGCLVPVKSLAHPGLHQESDVLLLPHLHGNAGQAGAGVALVQLGQNCLHKIYKQR